MRFFKFVSGLDFKQKVVFSCGAFFDKISSKIAGYEKLKETRQLLQKIEDLGFVYFLGEHCIRIDSGDLEIELRKESSDVDVFLQIFSKNEYQPVINCIEANNIKIGTIIDAGANIGLTTIKLLGFFPTAKVICLEPDPDNFRQLKFNLRSYKNVVLLEKALWDKDEDLYLDFGFRDGKEWSRSVTNDQADASTVSVKGVSLANIISEFNLTTVDFLKIDIEGSERQIFMRDSLEFLDRVKVLAMEIHTECIDSSKIYRALIEKNYVLFKSGELTVGVNMNYIRV